MVLQYLTVTTTLILYPPSHPAPFIYSFPLHPTAPESRQRLSLLLPPLPTGVCHTQHGDQCNHWQVSRWREACCSLLWLRANHINAQLLPRAWYNSKIGTSTARSMHEQISSYLLVSFPDQIFRAHPAALLKNRTTKSQNKNAVTNVTSCCCVHWSFLLSLSSLPPSLPPSFPPSPLPFHSLLPSPPPRCGLEAEDCWVLVQTFCYCHRLPPSVAFLTTCAQEGQWLPLLCHAQLYSIPPQNVCVCVCVCMRVRVCMCVCVYWENFNEIKCLYALLKGKHYKQTISYMYLRILSS